MNFRPHVYAAFMLVAIALSLVFWTRLARRDDRLLLIYVAALAGAFLGAKIVYLLAEGWQHFGAADVWWQLATGKSILGALLGGYAAVEITKHTLGYDKVTGDWFALIVPLAVLVGRIGCLVHGCCLGQRCESQWYALADATGVPRWPAVPAEMIFNGLAIVIFFFLRQRRALLGQHFHLYLISYGLFRLLHEVWRETPRLVGSISGYQFAAFAVVILGGTRFLMRETQRVRRARGPGLHPKS